MDLRAFKYALPVWVAAILVVEGALLIEGAHAQSVDWFLKKYKYDTTLPGNLRWDDCRALGNAVNGSRDTHEMDRLFAKLRDKDEIIRECVVVAIGKVQDPRAIDALLQALQDDRNSVLVDEIVNSLGNLRAEKAVTPLLALLDSEVLRVRKASCWALGQIKTQEALDPLINSLKDSDSEVRYAAASALGQFRNPRAIEPLITVMIGDANPDVSEQAERSLTSIGSQAIEPLYAACRNTKKVSAKQLAVLAVVGMGEPAVDPALAALNGVYPEDKWFAISVLAQIKDLRSVEPLIAVLKNDWDFNARMLAAWALGQINDQRSVGPLLDATSDSMPSVRLMVVQSLGKANDPRSVAALKAALNDTNDQVRSAAATALGGKAILAESARDGQFVLYNDGTVLDTKTNLMWAARDSGQDIDPNQANSFCDRYARGGYKDWRLPFPEELAGLYNSSKTQRVPGGPQERAVHLATDLIQLTSSNITAGIRSLPGLKAVVGAPVFNFETGGASNIFACGLSCGRVLPVRSTVPAKELPARVLIFDK